MIEYTGYHRFIDPVNGLKYGSFEVFEITSTLLEEYAGSPEYLEKGFYWWACYPGYLPDSEPYGPFETPQEAYEDALG